MPRRRRQFSPLATLVVALFAGVVAWFSRDHLSESPPPTAIAGQVVAVIDGDTVGVMLNGSEARVRLHGIDAPEKSQPFGDRAKRDLSERVFGQVVQVDTVDRDRYGRVVGRIHLEGRDVNVEMVRAGLAWWYRQYAPDDAMLADAEREARADRRGLWQDSEPVAPWEWRRRSREGVSTGD